MGWSERVRGLVRVGGVDLTCFLLVRDGNGGIDAQLGQRNTRLFMFPSSLVSWLEIAAAIFAGAKTFGRNLK